MLKRIALLIAVGTASCLSAFSWGRLGHMTIAEIAQRHLTAQTRENISKYLKGESLADVSCWMDQVAGTEPYKTELRGWHASIADSNCSSSLYVRKEYRDCRDGVTAMYFFREYLKDYKDMSDSTVYEAIKCIVHIVGDFHCPQHVRYTDCHNEGKYKISALGRQMDYHAFWDTGLIEKASGLKYNQYSEYADRLDTWKKCQMRKVSKGWAREWFEDAAREVRPTINKVNPGDTVDEDYIAEHKTLAENLIRKAGYQLACALNTIFGN